MRLFFIDFECFHLCSAMYSWIFTYSVTMKVQTFFGIPNCVGNHLEPLGI